MTQYLSFADCIVGKANTMLYFSRDAEIFEESLVSRPELAPHGLAHAMFGSDQVSSSFKLLTSLDPLQSQATVINNRDVQFL